MDTNGSRHEASRGGDGAVKALESEIPLERDFKRAAGYLENWHPHKKRQIMLGQVQQILEEYEDHLPLTARQIYYRMIAAYRHPKGKQFTTTLYELLVDARRAREIPFEAIRDDGINSSNGYWSDGLGTHLRQASAVLADYTLDRQTGQPVRLEVWCEAAGMLPQLARVTQDYSIRVYSCGGFNSLTAIRQIVDDVVYDGRDTLLLHLGDFDPSGVSIYERVLTDVSAFLDADAPGLQFNGVRVGLTEEQIAAHALPMDEITTRDSRSLAWINRGRTEKCELEALPPDVIAAALRAAIEARVDGPVRDGALAREREARCALRSLPRPDSYGDLLEKQMNLSRALER